MNVGQIYAELGLNDSSFNKGLQEATMKLKNFEKSMTSIGTKMSLVFTAPLTLLGRNMMKLYDVEAQAVTQLETVIKSTGAVAGKTADELKQMAASLQGKTMFGDEEIIRAQALLLTFTGIKGAIYDKAIPAILDMSQALGQDLQSSTIMVGKALNDPIQGLNALRRVGVSFSEEQIAKIKQLVEAGKVQEAQLEMLNELQREFGGVSEAAAKTGLGAYKQMTNALSDLQEQFGKILVEALTPIFVKIQGLVQSFQNLSETKKKFIVIVASVTAAVGPMLLVIGKVVSLIPTVVTGIKSVVGVMSGLKNLIVANPYVALAAAVTALSVAFFQWYKNSNGIPALQKRIGEAVKETQAQVVLEQRKMNDLFDTLKKLNPQSEEAKRLREQLNSTYGQYLPKLLTEKDTIEDISKAQKAANEELAKSIILKGKQQAIEKELEGSLKDQQKALEKMESILMDNGWSASQASTAVAKLTKGIRDGVRWADLYRDVLGMTTSQVINLKEKGIFATTTLQDAIYDFNGVLYQERVAVNKITQGFDLLLASMSVSENKTEALAGNLEDIGDGLNENEKQIIKDIGSYEKLNQTIQSLQTELQNITTDFLQQEKDIPDDYFSKFTQLNKLQALKDKIDSIFKDTWTHAKRQAWEFNDELLKILNETTKDEISINREKLAKQLEELEKAKVKELALFGATEADKVRIEQEYADIRQNLLAAFALYEKELENQKNQTYKDKIKEQVQELEDGLLTQEQLIKRTYGKNVKIIEEAVSLGILTTEQADELMTALMDNLNEQMTTNANQVKTWAETWEEAVQTIADTVERGLTDMASTFLESVMTLNSGKDIGIAILGTFLDMLSQVGKVIVGTAIAVLNLGEAFRQALASPAAAIAAIAAGAALIALASYTKSQLAKATQVQGLATGGVVYKGGVFKVGEKGEELVTLPRGAAVTPNHMLGNDLVLTTRISGRDLELILARTKEQTKRR